MKKEVRCIVCRTEFDKDELKKTAKGGCPTCGYKGLTMLTNGDVNIDINWFELRLICMWAESLALQVGDRHSLNAFYSVINEINKQIPMSGKITMLDKPPSDKIILDNKLPPKGTRIN
jgi:DNA-directed RNA polymerase subunit RPC12/RpoP